MIKAVIPLTNYYIVMTPKAVYKFGKVSGYFINLAWHIWRGLIAD